LHTRAWQNSTIDLIWRKASKQVGAAVNIAVTQIPDFSQALYRIIFYLQANRTIV